jgi:hypothetical protein
MTLLDETGFARPGTILKTAAKKAAWQARKRELVAPVP